MVLKDNLKLLQIVKTITSLAFLTFKLKKQPTNVQQLPVSPDIMTKCVLHPDGKHPLTECNAFSMLNYPEQQNA